MVAKKETPVKKPRKKKPDLRVVDVLDPVKKPLVRKVVVNEEPAFSFLNKKETLIVNLCLFGAFLSMAVFMLFILGVL